jgi:hypothetical protein
MVASPNIIIINIVTMFVKWRKPRIFCFAVSFTYITDNFKDFHIPQEHGFLRLLGIGKMFNASVGFWRRKAANESFFLPLQSNYSVQDRCREPKLVSS